MKYTITLLFSFLVMLCHAQGSTSFIGIGVKLQLDSVSIPNTTAAKIISFTPDGPALHSGLKEGDLIMKVNGSNAANISLDAVVKQIIGEEGTTVSLEVKRGNITKTFSIPRRKIAIAVTLKTASSSEFCTNITSILNDAAYHFDHVIDTLKKTENGDGCKLALPGTKEVYIRAFFGRTCYVRYGNFPTADEAITAMNNAAAQLKNCFPDFYYLPYTNGKMETIQIGVTVSAISYREAMMELYTYFDDDTQQHIVEMRIKEGVPKTYFGIPAAAQNTPFANAIRKVYDDVASEFNSIKGGQIQTGEVFNPSYWYEVNFAIPGAAYSYVYLGSTMGVEPKQCIAQFFLGDKDLAAETYAKFSQIIFESLGPEFIYSYDKPMEILTSVIPENAENVMIFAIKKERMGEAKVPVIALINQPQADGRYLIYLDFYEAMY